MAGQPTKLTPEKHKRFFELLKAGNTRTCAVGCVGIHYQTFLNWFERGRTEKSGQFFEFFESVIRAENEAEAMYVTVIAKAAKDGDWRASESFLKRRKREDWGDNVAIDIDKEIAKLLAGVASPSEAETP